MIQTIAVTGMTCANCVRHVTEALSGLPGVRSVSVDLASGRVELDVEAHVDAATLARTLEAEEYGLA